MSAKSSFPVKGASEAVAVVAGRFVASVIVGVILSHLDGFAHPRNGMLGAFANSGGQCVDQEGIAAGVLSPGTDQGTAFLVVRFVVLEDPVAAIEDELHGIENRLILRVRGVSL